MKHHPKTRTRDVVDDDALLDGLSNASDNDMDIIYPINGYKVENKCQKSAMCRIYMVIVSMQNIYNNTS